jgi:hypothetical protein
MLASSMPRKVNPCYIRCHALWTGSLVVSQRELGYGRYLPTVSTQLRTSCQNNELPLDLPKGVKPG